MSALDQPDETLPLYTLEELRKWESRYHLNCHRAIDYLVPNINMKSEEPRTLVCHDMKGGYLEDRYITSNVHFNDNRIFKRYIIIKIIHVVL